MASNVVLEPVCARQENINVQFDEPAFNVYVDDVRYGASKASSTPPPSTSAMPTA